MFNWISNSNRTITIKRQPDKNSSTSSSLIDKITPNSLSIQEQLNKLENKLGGFNPEHLKIIQRYAEENNYIIGFRPVEKFANYPIMRGYPTKNADIKGKSATFGPQTGYIPVNQLHSKLSNSSSENIEKYNSQINESINRNHARKITLVRTSSEIEHLLSSGAMRKTSQENIYSAISSQGPSNSQFRYLATQRSPDKNSKEERFKFHHILDNSRRESMKVLGCPQTNMPLTADYDLFTIGFNFEKYGQEDNLISPQQVPCYSRSTKMEPNMGILTERTKKIIRELNARLKYPGGNLIHHGDDAENPFTDLNSNFPAVFLLPKKLDRFHKICIIENLECFQLFLKTIYNYGFYIRLNKQWPQNLTRISHIMGNFSK
ncbi:MAG: CyaA/EF/ExoY family adenylyl cyclase toxin [Enterobacteriaceae bacterium]|jgi:adenylate cyclase ExoY|nr:CyaA/EF/ExoY family adenylyl cyclase toxin [Enterobacteriaceae bacterium]